MNGTSIPTTPAGRKGTNAEMALFHSYSSGIVRILLIFEFLSLSLPRLARADGGYVPEKVIRKLPEIPAQCALVAFRNGNETIIVESELEGQGRNFGWIIPVPSKPDLIEAAAPGTLKSLASGIQPIIVHDISELVEGITVLCLTALFLTIIWALKGVSYLLKLAAFLMVLFIFFGLLSPKVAEKLGHSSASGGAKVLEKSKVGSYAISVLAADNADALYGWLQAEDLAIPDALRPTVNDYTRRGWKFVMAKLVTDGFGLALPHPLRITFPSKEAVYPMKLTGLSGRQLNLELYVVADKAAEIPGLRREFCDQFSETKEYSRADSGSNIAIRTGANFVGYHSGSYLGHPGFLPALWDGCWISRLTGQIPSAAMAVDYVIAWKPPRFETWTVYSHRGAFYMAFTAAIVIFTITAIFAWIAWRIKNWFSYRRRAVIRAGLLAALVIFCGLIIGLPQTEVATRGRHRRYSFPSESALLEAALDRLQGNHHISRPNLRKSTEDFLQKMSNEYTTEPVAEEDSPGNYTSVEKDGLIAFTFYALGGTTVTVETAADKSR
jgi:hypothetical protein